MSAMQAEVYEALRAIDIPEDKALKASVALSKRDDDVADLKNDTTILKRDVAAIEGDTLVLKKDTGDLKRDNAVMKWMIGFNLAITTAIFVKQFVH